MVMVLSTSLAAGDYAGGAGGSEVCYENIAQAWGNVQLLCFFPAFPS